MVNLTHKQLQFVILARLPFQIPPYFNLTTYDAPDHCQAVSGFCFQNENLSVTQDRVQQGPLAD